ncbi:DNA polymerase III subunit beta [Caloramator mitchellensis]|uniref:Beta sliding clamp n=1 Tax=Caloramator mitchellensis TaxID=908809 RepID=A0A0R3JZD3_CALMK|nr:DNA polymerase III subunit beta [Caloramator mitchellensis]KRQ85941.1 DNA polymerase III subunit beta [Caloramator mitchellensis]
MFFTCEKSILQEAINVVQKASSSKTTYPILEGILINVKEDKVYFTATDLDIGIETYINANVIKKGSIVLNSKLFGEFIRMLPNDVVSIELVDNNYVKITCQKSEFTLIGNNPDEFPKLPTINENSLYEISQDLLRTMIKQTIFAIATDETRPILTGVLFEVKENNLSFVALDGYRLSLKKVELEDAGNISAVIPGKTLNEISKIIEPSEEKVKITFTPNHILFNLGNTKVISRLLDGEFVNYRQIIPQEYKTKLKAKKSELLDSIERASLLAREGKTNLLKFNIEDEKLIVTSDSQFGKVHEEVSVEVEGNGLKIAFNAKYFLEVLRIIDSEDIYLEFTTNVSPCVVKKADGDDYIYLVLPVRLIES